MSAWRTSGRVSTIVASTIALDEMWTYLGARVGEKRNDLWVWTAAVEERDGSRWMDFEAGGRDEATFYPSPYRSRSFASEKSSPFTQSRCAFSRASTSRACAITSRAISDGMVTTPLASA